MQLYRRSGRVSESGGRNDGGKRKGTYPPPQDARALSSAILQTGVVVDHVKQIEMAERTGKTAETIVSVL